MHQQLTQHCKSTTLQIKKSPPCLHTILVHRSTSSAVSNLFGTRDRFHGRQFSHRPGWGDGFRMIQAHYIYCALYFYCYYIVIYNEIIIQLAIMQNQWEPWACFHLPLTDRVWYESASSWFIMVSVQSNLSANDNLYLQPLPRASIAASAPPPIIRH